MNLKDFCVKNFRRLKDVHVELTSPTSIFVGANNSGKTSATHVFQLFLGDNEKFSIHDFSATCWQDFDAIPVTKKEGEVLSLPVISLDLWFEIEEADLPRVVDLLPSLDWNGTPLGVRIEFAAKDAAQLIANYREAKAKIPKKAGAEGEAADYRPWPKTMTDYLAKRLGSEFERRYFVLDRAQFDEKLSQKSSYVPLELGNTERSGPKILKSLLRVDFLNAQRHMSDISSPGRSEDLSKRLSKFYERNLQKRNEDETFEALRALANSETQLNAHLEKVFTPTLAKLNDLGYPGFFDPHLVIKSALNPETIMRQNAQVHYALGAPGQPAHEVILPDKYNGLGFKNLIYMVIEVLDFHSRWADDIQDRPPLHLIIIEEPEAHLHAQLQQVFIRKIIDILPKEDAAFFKTQLVITTHSPHIIYESGFTPIRYFRRSKAASNVQTSEVLNLSRFSAATLAETSEFLQRYMKLTHCDLFFADGVILVEGNVERLLLPLMISKAAPRLQLSYLSILEVGGAFAHLFRELVEFLGQTTLVITDLDSVTMALASEREGVQENAAENEEPRRGKSCTAQTADALTSNPTLKVWLPRMSKVSDLLMASEASKIQQPSNQSQATVRVCYQTVQEVSWKSEKANIAGRTLEEAFALENLEWCQDLEQKDLQLKVATGASSLAEIALNVYKRVDGSNFRKTEFALTLMTKQSDKWKVPAYIDEGLKWLSAQMEPLKGAASSKSAEANGTL